MSWPEDPRGWGGWAPWDPRWGPHRAGWGYHRPLFDNQLGWRLPTGGPPSPGQTGLGIALVLFVLGPATILAWVAGQALLRATGLRWWKLALAAVAAIAAVVALQGGPGPALIHHFTGYLWFLQQFGRPVVHLPAPGAFLWPQLPLSVPVGLLAAALNLAGRRQAIDPAEIRKTQREARQRMRTAVKRAAHLRDDPARPLALGVRIDGDLGWADKRGLVVVPRAMQGRSRLIVGTSGMGKTTDLEREALIAAKAGRKFFLIDGKGTDPGLVERALAGYLAGNPYPRVGLWPELPMDGWRGTPAALHNRLMAMLGWSEPYYEDGASLLLRLALEVPGEDGPIRCSQQLLARMDPELLVRVYEHDPDRLRDAQSLVGRDQARAVKGAITRFANFFAAVAGGFDGGPGGWSFENVDFAYFRAPYLAQRKDADACLRLLLEDFAHYATLRKPRKGEDATLVFDEFSAIAGGREAAIQLTERVRDAGCALYLSAQSADGLGDERQQARLVGACSGGLLLHAMPDPRGLLTAAGVVKVVEQTWRLDSQGPTGNSSARIGERPRIEATAVQQAREGEAWLIARGRYEHLMVARTAIPEVYRDRAGGIVALARSLRSGASLPGARSWAEIQAAPNGALVGVGRHLALPSSAASPAAPVELERDGGAPLVAGYRLRLAVIGAARDADVPTATALIREGQRQGLDPGWLLAVAARHWPPPSLHVRVWRAGRRWMASGARWAWARRPRRRIGVLLEREAGCDRHSLPRRATPNYRSAMPAARRAAPAAGRRRSPAG
jgi:hypothetical protein